MGEGVGGTVVGNVVVVWCGGGGWGIKKRIVVWQTWTLHQSSSIACYYVVKLYKS